MTSVEAWRIRGDDRADELAKSHLLQEVQHRPELHQRARNYSRFVNDAMQYCKSFGPSNIVDRTSGETPEHMGIKLWPGWQLRTTAHEDNRTPGNSGGLAAPQQIFTRVRYLRQAEVRQGIPVHLVNDETSLRRS